MVLPRLEVLYGGDKPTTKQCHIALLLQHVFKPSCSGGKLIECISIGATLLRHEPVSVGLGFGKFGLQPSDF